MFIYLAQSGHEIELPAAVDAVLSGQTLEFLDERGEVVARFPAAAVSIYSPRRIDAPENPGNERADPSDQD